MSDSDLKCKHALKGLLIDMKQLSCQFLFLFFCFYFYINNQCVEFVFCFSDRAISSILGPAQSLFRLFLPGVPFLLRNVFRNTWGLKRG